MSSSLSELYDRADALHQLAPWQWMQEIYLVALRHPVLQETAYLSIMGAAGSHRSLAVYLNEESLHRFNLMHSEESLDLDPNDQIGLIMESRQLQVSFESRGELEPEDLTQIKSLGRKYRGQAWPRFRSMHPGRASGPLSPQEVEILTIAITQILEVAPRFAADKTAGSRGARKLQILGREYGKDLQWRDYWHNLDRHLYQFPTPDCSSKLAGEVSAQTVSLDIQAAFILLPIPIGPGFGQQTHPYILLVVDSSSGTVLGVQMLSVETTSYAELLASVPDHLLRVFLQAGVKPTAIRTISQRTSKLLANLGKALNVPILLQEELPQLEEALESLKSALGRR